ncbi:unnamed protein product [Durusdinium trenchii]|uniref:Uncharacterized protein n=1 Tax=Durusdinium trenchii TaxID=1381693 RepID=A0ABP0SK84_9DINO
MRLLPKALCLQLQQLLRLQGQTCSRLFLSQLRWPFLCLRLSLARQSKEQLKKWQMLKTLRVRKKRWTMKPPDLSLFGEDAVRMGCVQIESSSESDESSGSDSSSSEVQVQQRDADAYCETVPEGETFFRHAKTSRVHRQNDHRVWQEAQ